NLTVVAIRAAGGDVLMNSLSLRSTAVLAALLFGSAVLPSSLTAQQDSTAVGTVAAPTDVAVAFPVVKVTPASPAGPRFLPVGTTNPMPASAPAQLRYPNSMGNGPSLAMMIVGGTGIVVGSVVGGDGGYRITVGGAVVGLIGLLRYLR